MAITEFNETQLAAARAKKWHQDGEALLTLEAARTWLNEVGLVLFAPKAQIAAPAPSLVEATLGKANAAPTLAETEVARGLVSRMVADGVALPLNLLGVPGDAPDFVVSAQVFSYVFTLRGNKAWKLPPQTSGAIKVSPLGLKVYEALVDKGALSAAELASELGREVTETAILRALVELWSQLRVLPLIQQGTGTTLWELTTRRFTKTIKAGANAGQPTALSALTSLYLGQALAATEDEIETFLSPLTARSRVREVLHALTGARQLETVVLEGKTLLHVPGALPEFPAVAQEQVFVGPDGEAVAIAVPEKPKKVGTGRIAKFEPESKGTDSLRGKAVKKFGAGPGMVKPSSRFGARADGKSDRERRPFKKDGAKPSFAKPSFTKPWEEEKKPRAAAAGAPEAFKKFSKPAGKDRKPLGDREQAGLPPAKRAFSKPKYERESLARDEARSNAGASEGGANAAWKKPRSFDKAAKPAFGAKRPYTPRAGAGEGTFAKRPYKPRDAEGGERPAFKPRSYEKKPGGFGAKRPFTPRAGAGEGTFAKRPYKPRDAEGGERPAFKPRSFSPNAGDKKPGGFGAKKPFAARAGSDEGAFAKRPYKPRDAEGGERPFVKRPFTPRASEGGESTYPKREYKPRTEGDRGDFKPRSFDKKPGGFGAKRPFTPRAAEGGEGGFAKPRFGGGRKPGGFGGRRTAFTPVDENAPRSLPKRPYKPRAADADQRTFTKAPWTPAEDGTPAKGKSFGSKPKFGGKGKFGPKKFGSKPGPRKPRTGE